MSRLLGSQAESLAAEHLARCGYRIVARNVTAKRGELDLVAIDGDTLCFVEVRARKSDAFGAADETVGPTKRRRLIAAARVFLARWRDPSMPCRFDVVAIAPGGVRVTKNAFDAE